MMTLAEAAALFPVKPSGKRISTKTVARWITRGKRGVRLRAEDRGGRWYTTAEWIEEFNRAVTQRRLQGHVHPGARSESHRRAVEILKRKWGLDVGGR